VTRERGSVGAANSYISTRVCCLDPSRSWLLGLGRPQLWYLVRVRVIFPLAFAWLGVGREEGRGGDRRKHAFRET